MNYKIIKSSNKDIKRLMDYKKRIIFEYAKDLSEKEMNEINNYVEEEVPRQINDYYNIEIDNKVIGCLLVTNKDDGILLDEIYLEEEYRNKGIGTEIIKNILKENDIVYLWVYKDNTKAISLYKQLGFIVIEKTESRYHMKYNKYLMK